MHQKAPKSFQTPLHMMSKFGELKLLQHLIQLSESNHLDNSWTNPCFKETLGQFIFSAELATLTSNRFLFLL